MPRAHASAPIEDQPRRMGSLIWEIANGSTKLTIDQNPQPNLCLQAALKSGILGIMLAEL